MSNATFDNALRAAVRAILPTRLRRGLGRMRAALARYADRRRLVRMRAHYLLGAGRPGGTVESFLDYQVRITDGPNFYMQFKDEFVSRIYHFDADRPEPRIIDGGGNIGMSVLYFKRVYPGARITCFEPDPAIFAMLEENLARNGLSDVRLIKAGLSGEAGEVSFTPDGTSGGQVVSSGGEIRVRVERLSDYLDEPVDFLKLNIEGEELPCCGRSPPAASCARCASWCWNTTAGPMGSNAWATSSTCSIAQASATWCTTSTPKAAGRASRRFGCRRPPPGFVWSMPAAGGQSRGGTIRCPLISPPEILASHLARCARPTGTLCLLTTNLTGPMLELGQRVDTA